MKGVIIGYKSLGLHCRLNCKSCDRCWSLDQAARLTKRLEINFLFVLVISIFD